MRQILPVGRIPFLVCAPFFHKFLENNAKEMQFIRFLDGSPREQNSRLSTGKIMLAPSSSIEYAKNSEKYVICNKFCTASTLEIRSVKLFSKYKWENLTGKPVHLTEQSDTSATLVKLFSKCLFKVEPIWKSGEYSQDCEARLLIGNKSLLENENNKWEYTYDLATVWQEWQDLPFVFGIWIIRKEALSEELRPLLDWYLKETETGLLEFKEKRKECLQKWEKTFSVELPPATVFDYYNAIDYNFTEKHEKSLQKFYDLSKAHNFIENATPLRFLC